MKPSIVTTFTLGLVLVAGCGGVTPRPIKPFHAEDNMLFENGADFVTNPDEFDGQWRDGWTQDLEKRVQHADAIALVLVNTLRNDEDPGGANTLRLVTTPSHEIYGHVPSGQELWLVSKDSDPGFRSVDGVEERLIGNQFVVFLKFVPNPGGGANGVRWHLSPATNDLMNAITDAMSTARGKEANQAQ